MTSRKGSKLKELALKKSENYIKVKKYRKDLEVHLNFILGKIKAK
jgi:hypothetical protein